METTDLHRAARDVIRAWESGDLASAVRRLAVACDYATLDTMTDQLEKLKDAYPPDNEVELTSDERFVLVEAGSHGGCALTPGATIESVLEDAALDEDAGTGWTPLFVEDLVTGDRHPVTVDIRYVLAHAETPETPPIAF